VDFDSVTKRFSADVVAVDDLSLTVNEGEFLILVGPSGCGKTTALRLVAGLEELTSGEIRIGDRIVNDLPPTKRDIAMVFQNYALYPHMTVAQNMAFPLRQQRVKKIEIGKRVGDVARLLSIEELLARRPRELSGGQRQRVAIGRALIRRPQTFLMDEPLSNLDAKLRVQMRAELISLHRRVGITTIYVTHDQTEAMTLGDRVVVMNKGIVQQVDAPERLYRHPMNTFVAGFIGSPGMNFLEGTLAGGRLNLGAHTLDLPDTLRGNLSRYDGAVIVGLRPEDIVLGNGDAGSIAAEVEISERLGPEVIVHLRAAGVSVANMGERAAQSEDEQAGELTQTLVARFEPSFAARAGDRVTVSLNTERVQLFDPESGATLLSAPRAGDSPAPHA
ncbi:MAG TPA: ABC transporter ATP-binding protein, partial [Gaiellaceae bacterium]